jgi:hypothetical protein
MSLRYDHREHRRARLLADAALGFSVAAASVVQRTLSVMSHKTEHARLFIQ